MLTPERWKNLIDEVRAVSEQQEKMEEAESRKTEELAKAAAMDMLEALEEFFAHRMRVFQAQMQGAPLPDNILPILHRMEAAVRKARGQS